MITNYYQKFLTSIRWASYEQLAYQGILVAHQTALSYVLGMSSYGTIGVVFASIYLLSNLLNLGLDATFSPFIKPALSSKNSFKTIILYQLFLQLFLFLTIVGLTWLALTFNLLSWLPLSRSGVLILAVIAALVESYKKTLRILLQNIFYIKEVALITVLGIALYVTLVWVGYACGMQLTLPHLILPLIASSLMSIGLLWRVVYTVYCQLPSELVPTPSRLLKRLVKIRVIGTSQRISSQFFSSNLLIPLSALFFGAGQAGIITLISSYTYFINSFIKRTLEVSSNALFSQSTNLTREEKQLLFNKATGSAYYALSLLATALIILYPSLIRLITKANFSALPAILFLAFQFSENFLIMYEKFFMAEEKGIFLFGVTAITLPLYAMTLYSYHVLPPAMSLCCIMGIRLATLAFFILFSFYHWGIKPIIPNPRHVIYTATACAASAYALSYL